MKYIPVQTTRGFSLIQVAIIVMIMSLALAAALPGGNSATRFVLEGATADRMVRIEEALRGYRAATGRLPCPAPGGAAITSSAFGREVDASTSCSAADFSSGDVVAGVIPTRTLNLPDEYALDGWGRRFTYVVDQRAATTASAGGWSAHSGGGGNVFQQISIVAGSSTFVIRVTSTAGLTTGDTVLLTNMPPFTGMAAGALDGEYSITVMNATNLSFVHPTYIAPGSQIRSYISYSDMMADQVVSGCASITSAGAPYAITISGDNNDTAMLAIISHGANGHCAFPARGSAVGSRINAGSTDASELSNASVTAGFSTSFDANFVKKTHTATFDDIVHYSQKCK